MTYYYILQCSCVLWGDDRNSDSAFNGFPGIRCGFSDCRFSANKDGFCCLDISVVVASAGMFRTSSRVVMLSRRFSFFRPFRSLYCPVLMPDYAFVISSVRMA